MKKDKRVLWVVEESGAWGWRFLAAFESRVVARGYKVRVGWGVGTRVVAYVPRKGSR